MIAESVYQYVGVESGSKLPVCAWPGGYPVLYVCADGELMCAACTNGENGSDARVEDDPQWNVVGAEIFYEGAAEYCSHCNAEIESAYGDPNANETSSAIGE